MYAYPIYLPEFSNREDLLLTVALFDDDTGDALDFSGCARGQPGDFSSNLWQVTTGNYVSISTTALTIPDYPIGSELKAVTLTIAPNLPILPGETITIANLPAGTSVVGPMGPPPNPYIVESGATPYITEDSQIFPPVTSAGAVGPNSMTGYVTSYTPATGAVVCQIGSTFQFELRQIKPTQSNRDGYSIWYDFGVYPDYGPLITLSLGSGLTMIGTGILQIRVPELTFRRLTHHSYRLGLTMTDSYDVRQVFVAQLPVQRGGVTI
jgi:hypothetical protein